MWFKSTELAKHEWRLVLDRTSIGSQSLQAENSDLLRWRLRVLPVHAPIITARHMAFYR
jgi:hypothetical protein